MADFWIIEYTKRLHEEGESNTYETHPQHVAVDVDSVVTIDKTKSKSNHTFIIDTGWAYYGRILKKVTEDDVMSEMDSERRKLVLELIASYDQVLVTVPDIKLLDNSKLDNSKLFSVNLKF